MLFDPLEPADERPQAGAVHEGHALQVHDDLVAALVHGLHQPLAQLRSREHVDLTLDVDDRPRAFLTRLNDEVDRRHPLIRQI